MPLRLTESDRRLREMTEEDLARWIWDVAKPFGWWVAHFRPLRTKYGWRTPVQFDGAGWPDLVMMRLHGNRAADGIAAELKREVGPGATETQLLWLERFAATGFSTYVWRPRDRQTILEVLTGQRGAQLEMLG